MTIEKVSLKEIWVEIINKLIDIDLKDKKEQYAQMKDKKVVKESVKNVQRI